MTMPMTMNGHLQPYEWALRRLAAEFGSGTVTATASPAGDKVAAAIASRAAAPSGGEVGGESGGGPGGDLRHREPYVVILRDPVLGDMNRLADPPAFLAGEIGFARAWAEGKSRRSRTFG